MYIYIYIYVYIHTHICILITSGPLNINKLLKVLDNTQTQSSNSMCYTPSQKAGPLKVSASLLGAPSL